MPAIILPLVVYAWFLTLREERRLRVFESRVLKGIFRPKGVEGTGGWRGLYNEELHNLYSSPIIIRMMKSRRMRWVRNVAGMRGRCPHIYVTGGKARRKETTRKIKMCVRG
jgi:hypothetical protein